MIWGGWEGLSNKNFPRELLKWLPVIFIRYARGFWKWITYEDFHFMVKFSGSKCGGMAVGAGRIPYWRSKVPLTWKRDILSHKILFIPGICLARRMMLCFINVSTRGRKMCITCLFLLVCLLIISTTAILSLWKRMFELGIKFLNNDNMIKTG